MTRKMLACEPMKLYDTLRQWRLRQSFPFSPAAVLIVFAAGCASPRPPRPPSLDLPEMVKDFTAQRTGDQVTLHWTTPEKTTDRLEIKGSVTAEICRIDHPALHPAPTAGPAQSCTPVTRLPVRPGASQAADPLPKALTTGPATLLAYRIQLFNVHGRSAGLSPQVFAAAGGAPTEVEQLRAAAVPTGAMLEWQPQNTSASVELERLLLTPAATHPHVEKPSAKSKPSAKTRPTHPSSTKSPEATPPAANEVKLQTPPHTGDAGGTIDSTAVKGETYRYTAQRVLDTTLDGHTVTLRSLPSTPVTLVVRDTFPPAVPTGLEAVPGGASPADRSIDLSWTPDSDPDLAGYFVYRQNVTPTGALGGPAIRLNSTPVAGPAWRDHTVVTVQRYAYRVTAVDTSGNESKPSADVQETLREP
jgi:hypothetical protein